MKKNYTSYYTLGQRWAWICNCPDETKLYVNASVLEIFYFIFIFYFSYSAHVLLLLLLPFACLVIIKCASIFQPMKDLPSSLSFFVLFFFGAYKNTQRLHSRRVVLQLSRKLEHLRKIGNMSLKNPPSQFFPK